jgi:integrase
MKPDEASVKLTYDKVKDGLFSVKLRICYQQERPRYHLPVKEGILVKPEIYKRLVTFHQTRSKQTATEVQNLYKLVAPFIEKAETIVRELPQFSFVRFEQLFYNTKDPAGPNNDLLGYLMKLYHQLEGEGRIGSADAYKNASVSLGRFLASMTDGERSELLQLTKRPDADILPFERVTVAFLNRYETWMLKFGSAPRKKDGLPKPASMTTVGLYLRQVRAAFNLAIDEKLIPETVYPFGRNGFVIPTGANPKKALKISVIKQIMAYECDTEVLEARSRDLWVFSYLSNGMNLTDICQLRWSDIDYAGGTITFVRKKTSRSRRGNQTKIVATLFPESRAILERWGNTSRMASDYVFPFVSDAMDARRKKATIKQVIKTTNKYTQKIAQALGIEMSVRTYEARHSFGSALLKSGADLVYIRDKFGHSSIKTTEIYTSSIHDADEQVSLRKSLLGD